MTPQELKNSILQLAIQGKLVEQRPEEGNAKELLSSAVIEDNVDGQRVKQKTITGIIDENLTFEIPESWEWVKLGNICTIARGGSPRPIKDYLTQDEDGINWIKIGDTEKNGKYISSTAERIKPSGASKSRLVHAGDFLLTNSMSFGRPYILKVDGCIHDGWLVISQSTVVFDQDFLYWMLSSAYAYSQFCGKVSGAVVKNLNSDKVANSVFPLPPLAEQKRIVAKIEELLPLIDRYEKAWTRLEDFNKRFPDDMQKSILQMAIQGKLVDQRPEEGTGEELYQQIQKEKQALIKAGKIKKEKPLLEITEDEIPFEIPESWKWTRLNDISNLIGDIDHKMPDKVEFDGIPYISPLDFTADGIDYDHAKQISKEDFEILGRKIKPSRNDIVFPRYGTIGVIRIVETDRPFLVSYSCCTIKSMQDFIVPKYVYYVLKTPMIKAEINRYINKTTQPNVGLASIKRFLFPLPPLAEQKRIVARLEELLPLCERLK